VSEGRGAELGLRARRGIVGPLAALLGPALLLWSLRAPIAQLGEGGPWGPADPWRNGDVAGAWWWWWAAARAWRGEGSAALLGWPEGTGALGEVLPNPLQLGLLGLFGPPSAVAWGLLMLVHVILLVVATQRLARAAGAGPALAAAAACLVAASPVTLHELAGGRPDSLPAWPGLLAVAFALQGGRARSVAAGALLGLQLVLYLWHGVLVAGLLLLLRPSRVRPLALIGALGLVFAPYLAWLWPSLSRGAALNLPPAGYTSLPIAGLFVEDDLPERFLAHPLLVLLPPLVAWGRRSRWLWLAGLVALLVCLGPTLRWRPGEPGLVGPLAWLQWALPPLRRLHHPIRAAVFALPLLGAALAVGLQRSRTLRGARGPVALALVAAAALRIDGNVRVATWETPAAPPYAARAAERADGEGAVIDLLGMEHRCALSLQPVHGRSLVEPFGFRRAGPWAAALEGLAGGRPAPPAFWAELRAAGVEEVWIFPRFGDGEAARAAVEAALGPGDRGVYRLPPSP
jgi:hypothetical protein